jgi:hypothetical protein
MDLISDSTLQLTLKKPLLVKFWCAIKEERSQIYDKVFQMLFSNYLSGGTLIHKMHNNRLTTEAYLGILLSSTSQRQKCTTELNYGARM